jgi:hypothetical protein
LAQLAPGFAAAAFAGKAAIGITTSDVETNAATTAVERCGSANPGNNFMDKI